MGPLALLGLGTAGAGLASKLFGGGGAYKKAGKEMEKYYNQGQGYLQPYNEQGQEAYGHLNTAMQNLLNPTEFYDQLLGGYRQSEASQHAQERARQSGLNNLSAMGMLGSTPGLQALQAGTAQIGAEDEQRYLENMINQYVHGAGLAQNIYGQGGQAAGQMAGNANQMGNNMAEMAYGRAAAPGQMFGNLMGAGAGLAGSYMGMQGMNNMADAWRTRG